MIQQPWPTKHQSARVVRWFVIIFQELNFLHTSINTIVTRRLDITETHKENCYCYVISNIVCTMQELLHKNTATHVKIWWEKMLAALYLLWYECSPAAGSHTQPSQQFIWQFYCGAQLISSHQQRWQIVFSQQPRLRECCISPTHSTRCLGSQRIQLRLCRVALVQQFSTRSPVQHTVQTVQTPAHFTALQLVNC